MNIEVTRAILGGKINNQQINYSPVNQALSCTASHPPRQQKARGRVTGGFLHVICTPIELFGMVNPLTDFC